MAPNKYHFIGGAPVLNNTIKRTAQKQKKIAYFEKPELFRRPRILLSICSRAHGPILLRDPEGGRKSMKSNENKWYPTEIHDIKMKSMISNENP